MSYPMVVGTIATYFPYDPDAQTYFNNIASNGGSISTASKGYVNSFVLGLKSAGLWSSMYEIYPYMGDQLAAAMTKLKHYTGVSPYCTNHNFVSGDYAETGSGGGLKGDGTTKYLDTSFNPATLGISADNFTVMNYQNSGIGTNLAWGQYVDSGAVFLSFGYAGSPSSIYQTILGEFQNFGVLNNSLGLLGATRISGTQQTYVNGAPSGNTGSQTGSFPSLNFYIFGANYNGTPAIGMGGSYSFGFIAEGLTSSQMATLYNLNQTLQTSLSRNV